MVMLDPCQPGLKFVPVAQVTAVPLVFTVPETVPVQYELEGTNEPPNGPPEHSSMFPPVTSGPTDGKDEAEPPGNVHHEGVPDGRYKLGGKDVEGEASPG